MFIKIGLTDLLQVLFVLGRGFIEVRTFCLCGQVAGDQAAILFPVYLCYSSSRSLNINRVLSFRGFFIRSSRSSSSLGGFV